MGCSYELHKSHIMYMICGKAKGTCELVIFSVRVRCELNTMLLTQFDYFVKKKSIFVFIHCLEHLL